MNWQAIETAPRDGSWILIGGGHADPEEWYGTYDEPWAVVATFRDNEWSFADWDGALRSHYLNPKWWMPLPALPNVGLTGTERGGG